MLKVKICGITNQDDAHLALEFGADALGFIFYDKSARYIKPDKAASIIDTLPAFVQKVGVFVNAEIETVHMVFEEAGLTHAQIHGDESPAYCARLSVPFIKAFRVQSEFDTNIVSSYSSETFLMDAYSKMGYGGTGETFNWDLAVLAKKYGHLILAGGLNSENILEAITTVKPYAVDISSGVESEPGKKDAKKMKRLFNKINNNRLKSSL